MKYKNTHKPKAKVADKSDDTLPVPSKYPLFFATVPGFEATLTREVRQIGFTDAVEVAGGVTACGTWADVWRANLLVRGASHLLLRFAEFRVVHLAKLDKQARKIDWAGLLRADQPFRVEVTCKKSRIYHSKAAAERIATAITETIGAPQKAEAELVIKARIIDDLCTLSIDTSGVPLHKRGHKLAVNKAPLRETLAALILHQCGLSSDQKSEKKSGIFPVIDPMCGSGSLVIEAAEIASGLVAGRSRSFAFEKLPSFDADAFSALKTSLMKHLSTAAPEPLFYGFDRDAGAIKISAANADRAGVAALTHFTHQAISDLAPPDALQQNGQTGLVVINPPYGARLGEIRKLRPLYQTLGRVLSTQFKGWRIALITSSDKLAAATDLPFNPNPIKFPHGGIPVSLYMTEALDG